MVMTTQKTNKRCKNQIRRKTPISSKLLEVPALPLDCPLVLFSLLRARVLLALRPSVAFTLVDIDGDGTVSRHDLVRYLELITAAPEGVKVDLVSQGDTFSRVVIG